MKYFLLMMLSFNIHALTVIAEKTPLIDAMPYLDKPSLIDESIQAVSLEEMPFTVKSKITPGRIESKKVEAIDFPYPLYVVGHDEFSKKWLARNQAHLKEIKAIGFITNIENKAQLNHLKRGLDIPLYPIDIDELAAYLKVSHYPFVVEGGRLWQ